MVIIFGLFDVSVTGYGLNNNMLDFRNNYEKYGNWVGISRPGIFEILAPRSVSNSVSSYI